MSEIFGELRSLVLGTPSQQAFHALVRLLEAYTPDASTLRYLEAQLAHWPDTIERHPSEAWLDALDAGEPAPALALCNVLDVGIMPSDDLDWFALPLWRNLRRLTLWNGGYPDKVAHMLADGAHFANLRKLELSLHHFSHDAIRALVRSPHLANLRVLDLSGGEIGDEGCALLAEAMALESLEELELGLNGIGPLGAKALANAPGLAGLRALGFHGDPLGDEGVAHLVSSPHLRGLRALWLQGVFDEERPGRLWALAESEQLSTLEVLALGQNVFEEEEAWTNLAHAPCASQLRELLLGESYVGDHGLSTLAQSSMWGNLRTLDLWGVSLGRQGARALGRGPWRKLERLDARYNPLRDGGAEALVEGSALANVRTLILEGCGLHDQGALALVLSPHLSKVEMLLLGDNGIGDDTVHALVDRGTMGALTQLRLNNTLITDASAVRLVGSPVIERLTWLDLSKTAITSRTAEALARSPYAASIETLHFHACQIDDRGAQALIRSPALTSLRELHVRRNPIDPSVLQRIEEANQRDGTFVDTWAE